MKKDNIRDYATEAFRYYAANGRKTAEELKQELRESIYKQSKREYMRSGSGSYADATAYAAIAAEEAVREREPGYRDIVAVDETLSQLTEYQRMAVEIVYFTDAEKDLERGDISGRVHKAEKEIPASTDTIYRWLRKARWIFAEKRGLRIF